MKLDGPLVGMGRSRVKLANQRLSKPINIVVRLLRGTSTGDSFVYWGQHNP